MKGNDVDPKVQKLVLKGMDIGAEKISKLKRRRLVIRLLKGEVKAAKKAGVTAGCTAAWEAVCKAASSKIPEPVVKCAKPKFMTECEKQGCKVIKC